MNKTPINSTTNLIAKSGRRKTVEKHIKRVNYLAPPGIWAPINCKPRDAKWYNSYKFEVLEHDLLLAFAPSDKRMPLMRITDPITQCTWALWFMGVGDVHPSKPIIPKLVDKVDNKVVWEVDDKLTMKFEVLGHKIRKLLILNSPPSWYKLTFRVARSGGAHLLNGNIVKPHQLGKLLAFRSGEVIPLFGFAKPSIWDSSSDEIEAVSPRHTPQYNITQVRTGVWDIEIVLDPAFLSNATYPVYIDPTIVLQPDADEGKDASMFSPYPDANYGAYTLIPLDSSWRELIQFDLSSIPTGSTILSSILTMYRFYDNGNIEVLKNRLLREWGEGVHIDAPATDGECSWNHHSYPNLWTTGGADDIGTDIAIADDENDYISAGPDGYYEFKLTNSTQVIVNGATNNGWRLATTESSGRQSFRSSDYGTSEQRPKLTIEYEEPSAGMPAKLGALAGSRILGPLATGLLK